jgi:predicted Zn finger-like uncharacterized protein
MILNCPSCSTKFTIDPQILGAKGRTVRCAKCKHQWHVTPPLITLPGGDMGSSLGFSIGPAPEAVAGAVPGSALFAATEKKKAFKSQRNAVIAATLAALVIITPFFFWRLASLQTVEVVSTQKTIALDGTPSTKLYQEEGRNVLRIEGALINNDKARRTVPRLVAKGMNAKGHVVKEWPIPLTSEQLEPGQRLPFTFTTPFSEQGVVDIAFHFM